MAGLINSISKAWSAQFPHGFFVNESAELSIAEENQELAMPSLVDSSEGTKLFIGALYSACNQPKIFEEKITTIITCTNDTRGFPSFNRTVRRLKENLGVQFATLTWKDDDDQVLSKDDLGGAINFIHKQRRGGESVLVHCVMGKSRSAALVLGYLMAKEKVGIDEALERLKACRESVTPRESFLKQLRTLDEEGFFKGLELEKLIEVKKG